ncbi:hypothetical protein OAQ39_05495 [Alphaproteobacteria bacterium]|nr:hypothetical protein [Alphaproteobacteria bacterium]
MLFGTKYNNLFLVKSLIFSIFIFILGYFSIGFALLSPENGDEGYFLRIIIELVKGREFIKDFATNQPVFIMYLFYPLKFFTTNYFLSSRILVGVFNFFILYILYKCLFKNNKFFIPLYFFFFCIIFLFSNNILYYSFEIRQWPIIYLLQILLAFFIFQYSNNFENKYIFIIGIILALLSSSRQTYLILFPIIFTTIFFYDFYNKKINKEAFKKYIYLILGFIIVFFVFLRVVFYDLNFALGLWYLINQSNHFSDHNFSGKLSVINQLLYFFGYQKGASGISIITFSSILLYLYLFFITFTKTNIFNLLIFIISTTMIFATFYGWSHLYHKEVFYFVFVFFLLDNYRHKNRFFSILFILTFIILSYNYFINSNDYYITKYNKNLKFFNNAYNSLINKNFHKIDFYTKLNRELDLLCNDDILTWDTRRGRLISSNSKCNYHPKIVNEYMSVGIMHRGIYSQNITDKIFEITLRPEELIFFILYDVGLILANDFEDLINEINLIIKRNSLDKIINKKICKDECLKSEDRQENLNHISIKIQNIILENFNQMKKGDLTFFERKYLN